MTTARPRIDSALMSDWGFHYIEDDLDDTWLDDWSGAGIAEIEAFLARHAAFLAYLDPDDS